MTTPQGMLELAERNLEAIIVRCEEGDKRSNWLPIIAQLAKDARAALHQAAAPQGREANSALTKIAAECHRAKWQFDMSGDYKPKASVARGLVAKAFDDLHKIGDMALKLRDALTPAVAPDGAGEAMLSEQERHAVGHARYQVDHATPDNPECCFDYELVATLIGVVDRLAAHGEHMTTYGLNAKHCAAAPPPQVDSGREEIARPGLPEALRAVSQRMRSIDGDRDHMNTSRLTCADTQAAFKLMDMAADALRPERSGGRG